VGPMNATAPVIALDTPAALDATRVGRKAANLAAARAAGLPVAPGVVLTSDWSSADTATALQVWRITSLDGGRPLVVRPSAAGPRARRSTAVAAGALGTATVVLDCPAMLRAIDSLRAADPTMPVLLQPHVAAAWRGVLFADDAAGGWRARPLVVAEAPSSGRGEWIAELDHAGRPLDVLSADPAAGPATAVLARVARVAEKVANTFEGPHDIEWVVADDGRVQLLRVRPVVRLQVAPRDRHTSPDERELVDTAA
jgi:rifampicin phosphotransferase